MEAIKESRQVRRARERAEAKRLKKQSKLGYIPSQEQGFAPDAGMNSSVANDNYYWFNTAEWALSYVRKSERGFRAECTEHGPTVELDFQVDIMDKEGNNQISPKMNEDGYLLTMTFTEDQLHSLANEIDKGGMSVRLTGNPNRKVETRGSLERPELIKTVHCKDVFSKGNDSGSMAYMGFDGTKAVSYTSGQLAQSLREVADTFEAQLLENQLHNNKEGYDGSN